MVFIAAMNGRTRKHLDNTSQQWGKALKLGEEIKHQYQQASPEGKAAMDRMGDLTRPKDAITFSEEDVRQIVEETSTKTLVPHINAVAPLFSKLDCCIIYGNNSQEFITSDSPCTWYDPEAYKRPPFYRSPALIYKSTEITFPISPTEMVYLNQRGITGYLEVPNDQVRARNRITRFKAGDYFVVNKNEVDKFWFEKGEMPQDSWENQNKS